MNIFEKATKQKVRFESKVGLLSVEDLWDLPLKSQNKLSLDVLAKTINRQIKDEEEESFVDEKSAANELLTLKMDIVKHIISIKKEENKVAREAAERKAKRERINELIAKRKDEELDNLSLEELEQLKKDL